MSDTTTVTNLSKRVWPQGVDIATATIKAALFTSASNITAASTLYSALTGEVSSGGGSGYTTGGNAVTSLTWSGTTTPIVTGTVAQWYPAVFTFRSVVFYDTATSKIINYTTYGADQDITSALLLQFDPTNGYIKVTSS